MLNAGQGTLTLPPLPFALSDIGRVTIIGCGTSFYAGMVAKYWLESLAGVPVDVDVASEFRYRQPPMPERGLALFISQSGETADTLAALRYCRGQGQHILSLVNVPESTIARESDLALQTVAGPEIGVASTKAFTLALPAVDPFVASILYAIPAQLLAYHVTVAKGTDVDQPRNLAKSVTVE